MSRETTTQITFDDLNRVRLLDADKFAQTESLAEEAQGFVTKMEEFRKVTATLVELLSQQSEMIEREKLLAIGQRNKLARERETRQMKKKELQELIAQKQRELDREVSHHRSLARVRDEQTALIARLTKGE